MLNTDPVMRLRVNSMREESKQLAPGTFNAKLCFRRDFNFPVE